MLLLTWNSQTKSWKLSSHTCTHIISGQAHEDELQCARGTHEEKKVGLGAHQEDVELIQEILLGPFVLRSETFVCAGAGNMLHIRSQQR